MPPPSYVIREASFVARCRTGGGMFTRYVSRFIDIGNAASGLFQHPAGASMLDSPMSEEYRIPVGGA